jgi:hypothetical protein
VRLQPSVDRLAWEHGFDVIEDGARLTEGAEAFGTPVGELAMGHGQDDGLIDAVLGLLDQFEAILVLRPRSGLAQGSQTSQLRP